MGKISKLMIKMDGTEKKSKFSANAILIGGGEVPGCLQSWCYG